MTALILVASLAWAMKPMPAIITCPFLHLAHWCAEVHGQREGGQGGGAGRADVVALENCSGYKKTFAADEKPEPMDALASQ